VTSREGVCEGKGEREGVRKRERVWGAKSGSESAIAALAPAFAGRCLGD
jgi:hypothetical protein